MTPSEHDDDEDGHGIPFMTWPEANPDDTCPFHAATAEHAAEQRARRDHRYTLSWPITYLVRSGKTGRIWKITVGLVTEPTCVAIDTELIPLPPATHVLWGGNVLCEDLRLREVPGKWPEGQRWISLKELHAGAEDPAERCEVCWGKARGLVELVDGLRPSKADNQ